MGSPLAFIEPLALELQISLSGDNELMYSILSMILLNSTFEILRLCRAALMSARDTIWDCLHQKLFSLSVLSWGFDWSFKLAMVRLILLAIKELRFRVKVLHMFESKSMLWCSLFLSNRCCSGDAWALLLYFHHLYWRLVPVLIVELGFSAEKTKELSLLDVLINPVVSFKAFFEVLSSRLLFQVSEFMRVLWSCIEQR